MLSPVSILLIEDVKIRLLTESVPRILKCLDMLSDDQVKYSFNVNTNSIANLIVHLEGNCSQWMLNSFMDVNYDRNRKDEFHGKIDLSIDQLRQGLQSLHQKIEDCLAQISESQLLADYTIQGFETNGVSILVHVTEHFSYHTGQIALITKILIDQATLFYDDSALNAFKK